MDDEVSFGRWLEKRRKALDLTRQELSQQIGCSVSALRKIEANERHPSKQLSELLASTLSIPEQERPVFLKAARGDLSPDRLKSSPPIPDFSSFQPPQTLFNPIPVPLTPLIGRESELATLQQMLADPQYRLITLVGPGGSGKTRLAIEAARNPGSVFIHGVVFVPMANVNSVDLVVPTIANAMNIKCNDAWEPEKQLLCHLRGKQIFLILDNLEHLLDGVAIVGEIIAYAPCIKVLGTSREQLNLHGEWVYEVRGLPMPKSLEGQEFDHNNAVALFLQRARQVKADLSLKDEDRAAIVRICKLVEGMPLAIELSAVWARTISFQEIALEIEKSLDFLSTDMRDVPERHRSLRAVFDHSWRQLTQEERNVLMKLTVFKGGFTRELAEQVAYASIDLLSILIIKSLLHRTEEQRYDLHETVRQYGSIQLEQAHLDKQVRNAHLQACIQLAERIEPELNRSEQDRWLAYLEIEHDNFRAALRWAFESGDIASSLRLAGALWRFWYMHSYFMEGSQWLEKALQSTKPVIDPALRAKALNGAGSLAYYQNRFNQAKNRLEECLALQSHLGERDIAYAQMTLAYVAHDQLDFTHASLLYGEALQRFRHLEDTYGLIRTLNGQGVLAFDQGNFYTAYDMFSGCLAIARAYKDKGNIALAVTNLGWTAAMRGDETAIGLCREAMLLFSELGNKLGVAFCLEGIGAGFTLANQPERAVQLFAAAHALRKAIAALPGGTHARHVESILQIVKDSLPEATFASVWAEGESLSLEGAISRALEE